MINKHLLPLLSLVFFLIGCSKYQVVSELQVNLYHLHNPKTGQIEVIVTEDKLEVGQWYRLNQIKVLEQDEIQKGEK